MKITATPQSWSIPEALAVAYTEFTQRFGAELLYQAFEALTLQPEQTRTEHLVLGRELDKYLAYPLNTHGTELVAWMASAKGKPDNAALLLHCGVRWWRARDDLARKPNGTRVPCEYAPGSKNHSGLQLLAEMLYRGSAPDTKPPAAGQTPRTRG